VGAAVVLFEGYLECVVWRYQDESAVVLSREKEKLVLGYGILGIHIGDLFFAPD
jgi:hypothetical protein